MNEPKQFRQLIGYVVDGRPKFAECQAREANALSKVQPTGNMLPAIVGTATIKATPDRTGYALSMYDDKKADATSIASLTLKLSAAYPAAYENPMFASVLTDAIIRNGMTEKQLEDAVNHLIDTCPYKTFSIADIVSYDKRVPLMDYGEYCRRCAEGVNHGSDFESVKVGDKYYWALKSDILNVRNGLKAK